MYPAKRTFISIAAGVFLAHGALLAWAYWGSVNFTPPPPSPQKFVVKTVQLQPKIKAESTPPALAKATKPPASSPPKPPEIPVAEQKSEPPPPLPAPASSTPKKEKVAEATPLPPKNKAAKPQAQPAKAKETKKVADKTPAKKDPAPKVAPSTPKPEPTASSTPAPDPKTLKLIAEAQEKIAKIRTTSDKLSNPKSAAAPEVSSVKTLASLEIEALEPSNGDALVGAELSYRDELASRLKLLLRLPEYGDVRIKLTLERSGKVKQVTITKADSTKNRGYIEKTLPSLQFPPFGTNFNGQDSYTFTVTLSNEI